MACGGIAARTALYGSVRRLLLSITGCVAVTSLGYGAQPPDVVVSDAYGNTAMGTNALFSVTYGNSNTAAGHDALYYNTTGDFNAAFGHGALLYKHDWFPQLSFRG